MSCTFGCAYEHGHGPRRHRSSGIVIDRARTREGGSLWTSRHGRGTNRSPEIDASTWPSWALIQGDCAMNRLPTLDPAAATGKTKSLFAGIEARLGMVPNMIR